jgi:hypothetical protein
MALKPSEEERALMAAAFPESQMSLVEMGATGSNGIRPMAPAEEVEVAAPHKLSMQVTVASTAVVAEEAVEIKILPTDWVLRASL